MRLLRLPVLILCLSAGLLAQAPVMSPGSSSMPGETTRLHHSPSQTVLAVWFPFEIMAAWTKRMLPAMTDEMLEYSAGFMRDYAVFLVQASHRDVEGRETFLSEAELGEMANVTDNNGRVLRRVASPSLDVSRRLASLRDAFRAQLDWENVQALVFDNKNADGAFILQPTRPGGVVFQLRSGSGMEAMSLSWETPLPFRVSGDIVPPRKVKNVNPVYPSGAVSGMVQGQVWIEATIGVDGKVKDAKVMRSIPQLDQAALDAVRQWEFTPTLLKGVAVPVIMMVTVSFSLQ
jgi:TonB family protein